MGQSGDTELAVLVTVENGIALRCIGVVSGRRYDHDRKAMNRTAISVSRNVCDLGHSSPKPMKKIAN